MADDIQAVNAVRPVGASGATPEVPPQTESDAAPDAPPGEEQGSGEEYNRGNFDERFVREPDWGLRKYKETQAAFTKAQMALKESADLLDYAQRVGGGDVRAGFQAIQGWLGQYNHVKSNPKLAQIVDHYLQQGTLPDAAPAHAEPAEDPYEDESTKAMRDEIRLLKAEVTEVRGHHQRLESSAAQETIKTHLGTLFEKYHFTDEQKAKVLGKLLSDSQRYGTTEAGRQTLRAIMSPDGYMTTRTLALVALPDEEIEAAAQRKYLATLQAKKGAATAATPGVRSTGREAIESDDAITGIKRFAQELGVDLNNLSQYM